MVSFPDFRPTKDMGCTGKRFSGLRAGHWTVMLSELKASPRLVYFPSQASAFYPAGLSDPKPFYNMPVISVAREEL